MHLSIRQLVAIVLVTFGLSTWSSQAAALSATVAIRSGETVEVEVLELEPGQWVQVKFASGKVKEVPWSWVTHLDMKEPTGPQEETDSEPAAPPLVDDSGVAATAPSYGAAASTGPRTATAA